MEYEDYKWETEWISVQKGYARFLEGKRVEWDGEDNAERMMEQIKQEIVESAGEVCGSMRLGERNPKSMWRNNQV